MSKWKGIYEQKGNVIPAKCVSNLSCSSKTCSFKCNTKITEEEKEEINRQFWKLKDDKKIIFNQNM